MTTIWAATAKGQAKPDYRLPVDISATGGPSYVSVRDLTDTIRPSNKLTKWRVALGKMRGNSTYRPRILCIGASSTWGLNSNGASTGDMMPLAYPTQLTNMLNAAGINAQTDSILGGSAGGSRLDKDGRVTNAGAWALAANDATGWSISGRYYTSSTSGNLSFLPYKQTDTFKIWYISETGNGVLGYNINGSGASTVDTSTNNGTIQSFTTTATLGTNTLNLSWSSGGAVKIIAVEGYNSAVEQVSVMNAGWGGSKAADWTINTNFFSPLNAIAPFAPDLSLINLGINDLGPSTPIASYKASLQTLITQCLTYGDVALVAFTPVSIANKDLATQGTYIDALYELGVTNNIPVIDLWRRFVSYEIMNPLGMYFDALHPNGNGYADMAQGVFNVVGQP
jgi:lysophospholipase L1-like esterase